ncbi:sterol carrier family protein [Actinocorallia populi]|uniref:sterol carrier family protein n=1 Tax=Actinocorallia populi TaxID=2079200 RepID=UPI002FCD9426
MIAESAGIAGLQRLDVGHGHLERSHSTGIFLPVRAPACNVVLVNASMEAVARTISAYAAGERPERAVEKAAVKHLLGLLVQRAPGKSVEVRIPPYAAVQCVAGTHHTRGTPPNVVETDARSFVELATGRLAWAEAVADGRVRASGTRSDLGELLPLITL